MTSGARKERGDGPEPPKALAIIIACVVGAFAVAALLGLVSLMR